MVRVLVFPIAQIVHMVSQIDNESSFHWFNGDPVEAVLGGLEATDLVLKEKSDGSWIGVPLEPQRHVWLWAFWVEVDDHFLVHIQTGLGHSLGFQPQGLRDDLQKLACELHQLFAILLYNLSPAVGVLGPAGIVARAERIGEVGEDFSPVQHALALEMAADDEATALAAGHVEFELLVGREGEEASGELGHAVDEIRGDSVVENLENAPFLARRPHLLPHSPSLLPLHSGQ
eukprot:Gb_12934 [translate_table: standard]